MGLIPKPYGGAEVLMRLVGRHQHRNAEAAVTAALVLRQGGFGHVNIHAISDGLAEAQLPGRFEVGLGFRPPGTVRHFAEPCLWLRAAAMVGSLGLSPIVPKPTI